VRSHVVPLRRVEGTAAELSDEALVAACATGETAALGALYDRHADGVRRFLYRLAGTDDRDLDDLVQATFVTVSRAARKFDGRSSVRTWLIGIANNTARHHVRSEIRRRRLAEAAAASYPRTPSADLTDDMIARQRRERLSAAIAQLAPKFRDVFVLVYLEGLSGADAATVLDTREGTIWKRLHEARAKVRELVGAS
jgi:RNA polymerase sigma-70 factor (ECF subfamily)